MKYRMTTTLVLFSLSINVSAVERIIDTRDGSIVSREQLVQDLSGSEFILLGEMHDNPMHHQHRGELLAMLKPLTPAVVAEHLERGKDFVDTSHLQADLELAGFDAKGWRWPLHEPLFASAREHGLPLTGGNITREVARNAVRQGTSALAPELMSFIEQYPLPPPTQATLDDDLLRSHCGHLPSTMLDGLRLAQRARDAAMFDSLQKSPDRPAVLLAGNGHVRLDYGVPSFLRQFHPESAFISIGFLESDDTETLTATDYRNQYDYLWVVEKIVREDPCLAFQKK